MRAAIPLRLSLCRSESLIEAMLHGIKKGSEKEASLALNALALSTGMRIARC